MGSGDKNYSHQSALSFSHVLYALLIFVIFAGYIGSYFTAEVLELRELGRRAKEWQVTMAQVTAETNSWREGFLSYSYSVEGKPITGLSRYCWNDILVGHPCNEATAPSRIGTEVAIRFNPTNPNESILESAVQEAVGTSLVLRIAMLIGALILVPASLFMIFNNLRKSAGAPTN